MIILTNIFNNKFCKKALMVGAIVIGGVSLLSGIWLASVGDPASMAGLIGGMATLAIGCYGLYKLKCNGPT